MLLSPSIEEDSSLTTTNSECTAFISEVAVHEYEDQGLLPARSRNDSRFSIYNIALLCVLTHLMSLFYVGIIYASLRGHIFQNACEGQHFEVYCTYPWRMIHDVFEVLWLIFMKAPARNALEYESRLVDGKLEDNPFVLAPGPESNAAWHSLLQGFNCQDPRHNSRKNANHYKVRSLKSQLKSWHRRGLNHWPWRMAPDISPRLACTMNYIVLWVNCPPVSSCNMKMLIVA